MGRNYDRLIVLLAGAAGYAGAPGWFILLAAFGLSIESWWGKVGLLDPGFRAGSTKKTAYVVTGAISNLGLAGLCYLIGHMLQVLTE